MKLLEAALSVPIRMRLCPDADTCALSALLFSENAFASSAASGADSFWKFAERVGQLSAYQDGQLPVSKLMMVLRGYGSTFEGKTVSEANAKVLKSLAPYVVDLACRLAFSLLELVCPELREATVLMRSAQLSAGKIGGVSARESIIFIFDCLRVARLTGDCPKGEALTVAKVTG